MPWSLFVEVGGDAPGGLPTAPPCPALAGAANDSRTWVEVTA